RTRLEIEHLEQRQLLSGNNVFKDVLDPPVDDNGIVGEAPPDVGGGQEQGEGQALVDRALSLVATIQDGLSRGQVASDEQLRALAGVGLEVWQQIQNPGDQDVRTLVGVQGALATTLDRVLLARWLTAGAQEGEDGQAVDRRLDANQLLAEETQVFKGLYQGVLPQDDQALIGTGLSLAEEIRRVADEAPGSRYLIELSGAQGNLVYTLDAVQIAL